MSLNLFSERLLITVPCIYGVPEKIQEHLLDSVASRKNPAGLIQPFLFIRDPDIQTYKYASEE